MMEAHFSQLYFNFSCHLFMYEKAMECIASLVLLVLTCVLRKTMDSGLYIPGCYEIRLFSCALFFYRLLFLLVTAIIIDDCLINCAFHSVVYV